MLKKSEVLKEGRVRALKEAAEIIKRMLNEAETATDPAVREIMDWLSRFNIAFDGKGELRPGNFPVPYAAGAGYDNRESEEFEWKDERLSDYIEYNAALDRLEFPTGYGLWYINGFLEVWRERKRESADGSIVEFYKLDVVSSETGKELEFDELVFQLC